MYALNILFISDGVDILLTIQKYVYPIHILKIMKTINL